MKPGFFFASMIAALFSIAILAAIIIGPDGASANERPLRLAVWSEFLPYETVIAQLPQLKAHDLSLIVAINADHPDYDGFAKLYKQALAQGTAIRPWLLLRESDGYWFNKWNFAAGEKFVHEFLHEMETRDIHPEWIVFDIESPPALVKSLQERMAKADLPGAIHALRESAENGALSEAQLKLSGLVEELHSRGIQAHAVTSQFVLNDHLLTGKMTLQNALGLPVQSIPWDEVSFMVYRPEFKKMVGSVSAAAVYRYAKRAKEAFGDKAGIDLGEIGTVTFPEPFEGYTDPAMIQEDFAAVSAAGISEVHLYSLDGLIGKDFSPWVQVDPSFKPKRNNLKAAAMIAFLDKLGLFLPAAR